MLDYYVRHVSLPRTVEGVSIPNDDGTFDIYINSNLPPAKQDAVLRHELRHLKAGHFYLEMPIASMEKQAEGEAINVVLHPPEGMLPCFHSPAHLAAWIDTLCKQYKIEL